MSHVVTHPYPAFTTADGKLSVHQLPAATDNLVWALLPSDGSGIAAVDGPDAEAVLALCSETRRPLAAILNTHTHGDHIGINRDLGQRGMLAGLRVVGPRKVAREVPGLSEAVDEGNQVEFGGSTAHVFLTEGHKDGHISFAFPGVLFCGDTMFAGGCGYLFDGPPAKMFDSLLRLAALPPDTRVCCAHEYTQDNLRFAWMLEPENQALRERIRDVWQRRAGGHCVVPSTIAEERATNPFLRSTSAELREQLRKHLPSVTLDSDLAVFTAARALKDRKDHRAIRDEDLPL